tara:strand:+ start:716 stop:1033 length:318 start_codon:yes stop_codon:yes gene_type:complete
MARFEAQVWVSGEIPYQAEINAANVFQARKNIARREGVDEKYVNRVFQVQEQKSSSSESFSSGESSSNSAYLLGGLLLLGLIVTYWYYVIPVAIILGVLWYFGTR